MKLCIQYHTWMKYDLLHPVYCTWVEPHIFVQCPFCNYYPILFQLSTWYYCGNCFKLMLWMWCQCFRSIFQFYSMSLLITQYISKLVIFDSFVSYTWTCCLSSNWGNNKNTFNLGNWIICVFIPCILFLESFTPASWSLLLICL